MILSVEVFGRDLPSAQITLIAIGLIVAFYFVNRSNSTPEKRVGHGAIKQCPRCHFEFQPEQVELLDTGDVRRSYDEVCPKCGWNIEQDF